MELKTVQMDLMKWTVPVHQRIYINVKVTVGLLYVWSLTVHNINIYFSPKYHNCLMQE